MRIGMEQHEFYYCLQFIFKNLIHLHSCKTRDVHVDLDELQPVLPALKSLAMLQIHRTVRSTYCPNQLFEGATAGIVFVFSSLQAITAKQELKDSLFPSVSMKIHGSTQILKNRYGHTKKSATFDYPIGVLGLWQGRETNLSKSSAVLPASSN